MSRKPKTDAPEELSDAEKRRIVQWTRRTIPGRFSTAQLRMEWEKCRAWHEAHGVQRASWEATFRNWLLKALEIRGQRELEKPQEPGERGGELVDIREHLRAIAGGKQWSR